MLFLPSGQEFLISQAPSLPSPGPSPHQRLTTGWDSGITAQVWLKPFVAEAICLVPTLLLVWIGAPQIVLVSPPPPQPPPPTFPEYSQ